MRLAYLLNTYPLPSTTFIRREIHALEALGVPVQRFASRSWPDQLVDPADTKELSRTEYLLEGNVAGLLKVLLRELRRNTRRLFGVMPRWFALLRRGGGFVRNVNYLLQAIYLRQRLHALGVTHVHAHFSTNAATVAMLSRMLGGPAFSFTVHGPDELVDPARNSLRQKVAESAFTVAITEYCLQRVLSESDPAHARRVIIVPCGLDLGVVDRAKPVAADNHAFVCVGRLCSNKGQMIIPVAVASLLGDFPRLTVNLIGDGEDRAALEQEIARLGVQDHVRLEGWRDGPDVLSRLAESRGLLLPSFAEGLPIVLMEALAVGRPVITTPVAGIPELIDEQCGWLIQPGDVEGLVRALRRAMTSSVDELTAMGHEGRRRIERTHDVGQSATLLLNAIGKAS